MIFLPRGFYETVEANEDRERAVGIDLPGININVTKVGSLDDESTLVTFYSLGFSPSC